jgi:mannose-6-phosphate isomerase-like protein (cupin superfamily)
VSLLVPGVDSNTMSLLADGDARASAIRSKLAKDTDGAAPHYHNGVPEMFSIIKGDLHVLTGGGLVTVGTRDFLVVPPTTRHAFHQWNVTRGHRLWPVGGSGQVPAISELSV